MRRYRRMTVPFLGAVVLGLALLMPSSDAQFPEIPDFTIPTFTVPVPPTMPPIGTTTTTSPPPTMPPSTSPPSTSPPPTMPPTTISSDFDAEIEDIIDQLEEFGDRFAEILEELRDLQARF